MIFLYRYSNISIHWNKVCSCQYMSVYTSYPCISYVILVYSTLLHLICVYQCIYAYIRLYTIFKTISKIVHNCRIQTHNLVHTFLRLYHYAASVNTSVLVSSLIRIICNNLCTPRQRHLAAGVEHPALPPQRPTRLSGHLIPRLGALTRKSWSWQERYWHGGTQAALTGRSGA